MTQVFLSDSATIEILKEEIAERDRTIAQMTEDYNSMRQGHYEEIQERDRIISLHMENYVYKDLKEQLKTASRRFVSIRQSVREIFKNLKDTRVHLNSLRIDMGLLGSWSKNWDKEETAYTALTHREKNKLANIKAIQLKHLENITEKNLKELSEVFEMVKTDDNDNHGLDEIPF